MPDERVSVRWEIAHDEGFRRIARFGDVLALPELGHSVHVEAGGLEPDRVYWYRFIAGGQASPVGRTRTAPAADALRNHFAFAFVSCQNYEAGYYTPYRHLAAEDLGLVVHLGDYIYEGGIAEGGVRRHTTSEIVTLEDYRTRYALYKMDPDLQAAHAAFPWVLTWDDHEVDNNYAGEISQDDDPVERFLQRRAGAYQAYYEHMPLRRTSMPSGPDLRLFRRLAFGRLAEFNVLDTRQYRTDQPCGDGFHAACAGADDPEGTMLGTEQERWLLDGLGRSGARWNVLANQVPLAPINRRAGPEEVHQMDKWDGYVASREAEVKADSRDPTSEPIATEFVGTSISSGGDGSDTNARGAAMLAENPHMKFYNAQRGYVRCALTPERWTSDYRVVEYVTRTDAPIRTRAAFVIEDGRPGVQTG
jgi:alkaline phosphatase D